jgi:hypothetical protein
MSRRPGSTLAWVNAEAVSAPPVGPAPGAPACLPAAPSRAVHNSGAATIELKLTFFGAFMDIAAATVMRLTSDTHQIEFRVTSEGSATINIGAKPRIDSQQNGNQVELTVLRKPGISIGFSDKRLRTEVRMPKDADLQVETADGSVNISSVNRRQDHGWLGQGCGTCRQDRSSNGRRLNQR